MVTEVRKVIKEHFPSMEVKKIYNESPQTGGTQLRYHCIRYVDKDSAAWVRCKGVLESMGVTSITWGYNSRGGTDLFLTFH